MVTDDYDVSNFRIIAAMNRYLFLLYANGQHLVLVVFTHGLTGCELWAEPSDTCPSSIFFLALKIILIILLDNLAALAETGQSTIASFTLEVSPRNFGTNVAIFLKKHCFLKLNVLQQVIKYSSLSMEFSEQYLQTL